MTASNLPGLTGRAPAHASADMNYYIPQWEERTSYGFRRIDPYAKLFEERIIFLGTPISDDIANAVMAQLLCLESMDPDRDISIYINSPGGSISAGLAIYDTMQFVSCDVATYCIGQAASMGAVLLTAGASGKRYSLPNARIMIHQPLAGMQGTAHEIDIHVQELRRVKRKMNDIMIKHTGHSLEKIEEDTDRDRFMSANEARDYNLIDKVVTSISEKV